MVRPQIEFRLLFAFAGRFQHATESESVLFVSRAAVPTKLRPQIDLQGSVPGAAAQNSERFVLRISAPLPDVAPSIEKSRTACPQAADRSRSCSPAIRAGHCCIQP